MGLDSHDGHHEVDSVDDEVDGRHGDSEEDGHRVEDSEDDEVDDRHDVEDNNHLGDGLGNFDGVVQKCALKSKENLISHWQ